MDTSLVTEQVGTWFTAPLNLSDGKCCSWKTLLEELQALVQLWADVRAAEAGVAGEPYGCAPVQKGPAFLLLQLDQRMEAYS